MNTTQKIIVGLGILTIAYLLYQRQKDEKKGIKV